MDRAFALLCALREAPEDRLALERFLAAVHPRLIALSRRFSDPSEIAQRAWIIVSERWRDCRADAPARLGAWLRSIVRSQGLRPGRRRVVLEPEALYPPQAPDEAATNRARGQAMAMAIEEALAIEPAALPREHRAWARHHDVAGATEVRRRNVAVTLAIREDDKTVSEVAETFGLTLAAAKKAAGRGAKAIALGARVRLDSVDDPWLREALMEIASVKETRRVGNLSGEEERDPIARPT